MAITYVGIGGAASSSADLPSFSVGDIAVVVAYNANGATAPSVPTGWTWVTQFTTTYGCSLGYRILQSGDTNTGTWTNATRVTVGVWRGVHSACVWDTYANASTASSTNTSGGWNTSLGYTGSLPVAIAGSSSATFNGTAGTNWTIDGGGSGTYGVVAHHTNPMTASPAFGLNGTSIFGQGQIVLRSASDYPQIADQDTTSGTVTSNSTSWTLTYPTNIAAGDLLIALVAVDGNANGNWTLIGWGDWDSTPAAMTAIHGNLALRKTDGTETGNFTVTMSSSEQGSWVIYRIPAGTWYGTSNGFGYNSGLTASSGTDTNPDPPSLNPASWDAENTLWITYCAVDTSRTVSAYPSSPDTFTNTGSLVSGGSNGATLAWGRLEKNASSVDPGTFTISNSDDWASATIAIRPAAKSLPPSRPLRHPLIYR